MTVNPVVAVAQGRVRGSETDGVLAFRGIPYAAAPVGVHRFTAPAPAPAWDGVRDALAYGPTAPAAPLAPSLKQLLESPAIAGEEYLNLNVWTPAAGAGRRPVLVWIHGGAFVNGSGAVSHYDGSKFARDGIVCVTINYRLGAEGFLLVDGAPANRGLLDQIAALQWVRDNIAAFGGDPGAVTVAGESAGAMSVTTLLSMPAAEGLFHRAITQSGAGHTVLAATAAANVTTTLAERLGVKATAEGFAAVPPVELVAAQPAVADEIAAEPDPTVGDEPLPQILPFAPVVDGQILTARPIDRLGAGASAGIDVLTGTNADEMALFSVPSGAIDAVGDHALAAKLAALGADPAVMLAAYRQARPDATPGELLTSVMTDWFMRVPAVRVAEARLAHGADTYVYQFDWPSPKFDGRLGACHTLEIGFAFDQLDTPGSQAMTGPNPPQTVADEMHRAWVSFITTGDPGWAPYGHDRTVRRLNEHSQTVTDPDAAQRRTWDRIL
ncbi:carboxylesterase family protein [Streptomyces sp. BPTC-684]|uniref:carboxylesterase/lipase family protein n=1 Tax=Streptomyces sp. BPTC-684 TaxID=3043734 RepID=UPI0024B27010|nr:carboxylesterase family protein [Streptomyces sp. BPTC-684]WHM41019.1 carboxylesterase family protein [Streptomyces sp. BPTC-684]